MRRRGWLRRSSAARRSSAQPVPAARHTIIVPASLELTNAWGVSQVIIWTPSDDGLLAVVVMTGPTNSPGLNRKMLSEPSHRPTAKCSASSHAASWAML
jgi:hypothetical protein